ncbi:dTMP kinase [Deinococcus psychrotolerans]|uniref:Thymidylate kinase n=1 Tax=Deinococcus psychrotolerans TaxID=2489213 RepID=A0A3G8YIN1_9DEIO|nr:dTMP kinase [Deinococcus psychrotolerans]AZI42394.1 dTMP kinase [Deinococcus psychrotolerans]
MTGLFISFEGPEGSGKSTQITRLAARLEAAGVSHTLTREPGGTPLGSRIREIVLLDPDLDVNPLSEFLLYSASRAQLVQDVIRPCLQLGEVVICDRYADSSAAYQGAGRGLDPRLVGDVTWEVTGGLLPHITVLLDLDSAVGLGRAAARGQPDRLERADLAFHVRVRQGFLNIAANAPERFLVLDAAQSADILEQQIWQAVKATLLAMGKSAEL